MFNFFSLQFAPTKTWPKKKTWADQQLLVARAVKELQDRGHTNVRPWCKKQLTGPGGWSREVDAAAMADNCALVVEHKNSMDLDGARQLRGLVDFIKYVVVSAKIVFPFSVLLLVINHYF